MWKCVLYSSRYSGDNNRQDGFESFFFQTERLRERERNKLISSESRIYLYLEYNSMVSLQMSLNSILLHFKFLKRSIYLLYWFDSIRETAERLIGSLVFELSKLPWLSEVHTMAGWKRELVCTKQSETGEEGEIARRKRKEAGINGFYRRLRHHATHIYFSFSCSQSMTFKSGQRFFKANRETDLFDINFK